MNDCSIAPARKLSQPFASKKHQAYVEPLVAKKHIFGAEDPIPIDDLGSTLLLSFVKHPFAPPDLVFKSIQVRLNTHLGLFFFDAVELGSLNRQYDSRV